MKVVFSLLAVLRKQVWAVACIWDLSEEVTLQIDTKQTTLAERHGRHLVSVKSSDGMRRMTVHVHILECCDVLFKSETATEGYCASNDCGRA